MKIISIKFLNLNSLKGQHEIHFDQPPFTESGIFAITGPTGAGKTTLLDAITVALYGRVHRHSKDVFEIMTRHTAESYAEVEFEVRDKLYRAKWSIRRSRGKADGQLQTQKMELADALSGAIIIEHPLQEVREEIVKLCGLDYNQFLRSVILSQGDFTRFLKADENERSELLEKITDTGIYSQISMAAYERAREERAKLDQLQAKLENVVLLTGEEREAYLHELSALSAQEALLKSAETLLRSKIEWLTNLEKLEFRKEELRRNLAEDELNYAAQEPRFNQLQKHSRALVHRAALAELNTIEKQQQQIEGELRAAELQQPDLIKEELATHAALTQSKQQAAHTEKTLTELEPVFETVRKKDLLIEQARSQFDRTSKLFDAASLNLHGAVTARTILEGQLKVIQLRINELSSWLKEHVADAALEKEEIVFAELVRQLDLLQTRTSTAGRAQLDYTKQVALAQQTVLETHKNIDLAENKLLEYADGMKGLAASLQLALSGKTVDELEADLSGLPVLINTAEQQLKLSGLQQNLRKEQDLLVKNLDKYRQQNITAEELLTKMKQENEKETTLLEDLQQLYELEVKVQKYDADRLQLLPAQPCPLCGALDHPFVAGKYTGRVTEAAERRNQQQIKLQLLKTKLDAQAITINSLMHQLLTEEKSLLLNQEALAQTLLEFNANNEKLPKSLDIHKPEIIAAIIDKKKLQQQALQLQLKSAKALQLQITALDNQVNLQKEHAANERNKAEQANLTINFAQKQLAGAVDELAAASLESKRINKAAIQLLEPYQISFETTGTAHILLEMSTRYNFYRQSEQELNQLQPDLRQKETELASNIVAAEEKKEQIEQLRLQLKEEQKDWQQIQEERIELFGLKDPVQERIQLQNELKKYLLQTEELQRLQQEKQEKLRIIEDRQSRLQAAYLTAQKLFKEHADKLIIKLRTEGLSSIAELNQQYLPEEEAEIITALQKDAGQKINAGKSLLTATVEEISTERLKALTEETKETLYPQLEEQDQNLSGLQQQKGKLQQMLSEDDQLQLKHLEVAQQIAQQQQEFNRFQKLSVMIGSADGKKFSRFAQGLTLARLTELANRHLLRLSDRYSILKSPEKDLDLQIIDGYQADVVRPMSTLSGGESFLVSLALALGLSDLASRKVQINSLFIDEGFGTLDAETLDVAITALENLQANGKNIGIISHVEALKDRIGTQIQLSKQPGGASKIALYSYGRKVG